MNRKGLLRGEAALVWLLQESQRARDLISGDLDGFDAIQLIKDWRKTDKPASLAKALGAVPENICLKLLEKISLGRNVPPRNFARSDLLTLLEAPAIFREALGIDDLDGLFDYASIQRLLREIKCHDAHVRSNDVESLLMVVLNPRNLVEQKTGTRPTDWGPLIEPWLSREIISPLNEAADRHDIAKASHACRLASLMDKVRKEAHPTGSAADFRFDSAAIHYLQQRFAGAADELNGKAVDLAENAADNFAEIPAIAYLAASIHFERGAKAKALRHFLNPKGRVRLGQFLRSDQYEQVDCTGEPDETKPLVLSDPEQVAIAPARKKTGLFGIFSSKIEASVSVSFTVSCWLEKEEKPMPILQCKMLTREDADLLRSELGRLSGTVLNRGRGSLSERLLQTWIPFARDPQIGFILNAASLFVPDIAVAMTLCDASLPRVAKNPWANAVSNDVKPVTLSKDCWFPRETSQIVRDWQDKLSGQGRSVTIIKDSV